MRTTKIYRTGWECWIPEQTHGDYAVPNYANNTAFYLDESNVVGERFSGHPVAFTTVTKLNG